MQSLLVEIQTAELPPKSLKNLSAAFLQEIKQRLSKAELPFAEAQLFATPRRLAVLIKELTEQQKDSVVERKGPALEAAFDAAGKPTPACLGFARSCGVEVSALLTLKNAQGAWVGYQQKQAGKKVTELLPAIIEQALAALPIPKRMRWGSGTQEFVRPVQSIVLLYGKNIIDAEILGVRTGRATSGHRFHCQKKISFADASCYAKELKTKGFVVADFVERRNIIKREIENLIKNHFGDKAHAIMEESLLDEVTGLVEWPVAVFGNFEKNFLSVPQEALVSAMQDHQRYFPIVDHTGQLLPHFVTISNIESHDINHVIAGNERVLRARLSDAAFFFEQDKKQTLASRVDFLKHIVFQAKLGTLFDKTERIAAITQFIAEKMHVNATDAMRAALLCKTDLTTHMVGEFPELQGVMGYYYALHDGEHKDIAKAIREHYLPRFSGDILPETSLGIMLALADRVDTLISMFAINQAPTGDKDPLGLRRAALGILRILIEKKWNLDLQELFDFSFQQFSVSLSHDLLANRTSSRGLSAGSRELENKQAAAQALTFVLDRLKPWYAEQGVSADVIFAVTALHITKPYDFHHRVQAVNAFKKLPDAESLSIANKRVSNILSKYDTAISAKKIDESLFASKAEQQLSKQLSEQQSHIAKLSSEARYTDILMKLAHLRKPVDDFFDQVMVMVDDKAQRENRLLLLKELRDMFLQVADIALLQEKVE
ncbi:hypothetical protein AYO45_04290 [Gammaproteobacteria bacterium SCGC AG-212-F23]|nr:hypothetical protein AYO45_04290 [Gammaproteobacteria bacterium SCGC AG-212-F23]